MIYVDIYESLIARLTQAGSLVKHVDLWNYQTEPNQEGKIDAFLFPAVFVEFPQTPWESKGNKKQQANMPINLYIASDITGTYSSSQESAAIRNESVDHLKLCSYIFALLHGWNGNDDGKLFGSLKRTNFGYDHGNGTVIVHQMQFLTLAVDEAAEPTYVKADPQPDQHITKTVLP